VAKTGFRAMGTSAQRWKKLLSYWVIKEKEGLLFLMAIFR